MVKKSAGRVSPVPKGEYSPTITYIPLDVVTYYGDSWICKKESTGNTPNNGEFWQSFGTSEYSSRDNALLSQSYATGDALLDGEPVRDNQSTDNAKYYSQKSKEYMETASQIAGGNFCTYNKETGHINDSFINVITREEIINLFKGE